MKKIILTLALFASVTTYAGGERGNGGDAVLIDGKYYLLDLVEAGVEQDTYWNAKIETYPKVLREISKTLNPAIYPTELIAKKISEIGVEDTVFAWLLLSTIKEYNWSIVTLPVVEIPDTGDTPISSPEGTLVQAAVRNKDRIAVSRTVWNGMDSYNRAALILHEVIYALVRPQKENWKDPSSPLVQDSVLTRKIVGYAFSTSMDPQLRGWKWVIEKYGQPTHNHRLPIGYIQDHIFESKYRPGSYFLMKIVVTRFTNGEEQIRFSKSSDYNDETNQQTCDFLRTRPPGKWLSFYPLTRGLSGVVDQKNWEYESLWSEWNLDLSWNRPASEVGLDSLCEYSFSENRVVNPLTD